MEAFKTIRRIAQLSRLKLGVKFLGDNSSLFVTYFSADISEARAFEVTTQTFLENAYESSGFEIEADYDFGFKLCNKR